MKKIILISLFSLFIICSTGYAEIVDNGDDTVTDTKTKLVWQKAETETMTWKEAVTYCETLVLAGHCDWRLPNQSELQAFFDSIYDNSSINRTAFPNLSYVYWSSNANADDTGYSMTVSFMPGDGSAYAADKNNGQGVKAVRGGQ